jgi:hypothetical protein
MFPFKLILVAWTRLRLHLVELAPARARGEWYAPVARGFEVFDTVRVLSTNGRVVLGHQTLHKLTGAVGLPFVVVITMT